MKKRTKYILVGVAVLVGVIFALLVIGLTTLGPGVADYKYQLTGDCYLGRTSAYDISIYCDDMNQYIPADVTTLGWNNSYIVATTNPVTKTDPNNPNCIDCDPDTSTTYWWITDVGKKTVYGPLDSQEFNSKDNQLGITKVPLWSVDEAKSHATVVYGELGNMIQKSLTQN
jgi:hypothetical protein